MFKKDHHNIDHDIEVTPELAGGADAIDIDGEVVVSEDELTIADTLKKLREKIKKLTAEKQEYLDGWQRSKADFVNARKRDEESRKEFLTFAKEDIVAELIPVLESFDMARANKAQWESVDKNWRVGVEYIQGQLKKILEQNGLAEVNPVGEAFDPFRDEALAYDAVSDQSQHHRVLSVVQKGYTLAGKPLRPAKVRVGEYTPPDAK